MNDTEVEAFIRMVGESNHSKVNDLDAMAWRSVLAPIEYAVALSALSEVKTRKPYVNPSDLNPETDGPKRTDPWKTQWEIVSRRVARLGTDTAMEQGFGDPTTDRAARSIAKYFRDPNRSTSDAGNVMFLFKAEYERMIELGEVDDPAELAPGYTGPEIRYNHEPTALGDSLTQLLGSGQIPQPHLRAVE